MKNNPLISIILPVYNGEAYLAEAIESVLNQKYKPIEIIVVDDGSTDKSAEIVKRYSELKYFFQTNKGTASARNLGIQKANSSFLAFLDQDDLWVEKKLELQVKAFMRNPETDIVYGYVKQFLSLDIDESLKQKIFCPSLPMPGYLPSAMLIKKEAFLRVGLFDSAWQIGEWANWYVRSSELKLNILMLPDLIALRRLHSSNKGVIQRQSLNEYIRILKTSLDRRRNSSESTK